MQLKFFTIPINLVEIFSDDINEFLRSVKILEINKDIVEVDKNAYWAICITYLPQQNATDKGDFSQRGKKDYKNILSESAFKKFCLLRKIRKQLADEDAVPAFAVFTDSELSEISQSNEVSIKVLKSIKGIGSKKIEKYGEKLCETYMKISEDEEERETF